MAARIFKSARNQRYKPHRVQVSWPVWFHHLVLDYEPSLLKNVFELFFRPDHTIVAGVEMKLAEVLLVEHVLLHDNSAVVFIQVGSALLKHLDKVVVG